MRGLLPLALLGSLLAGCASGASEGPGDTVPGPPAPKNSSSPGGGPPPPPAGATKGG